MKTAKDIADGIRKRRVAAAIEKNAKAEAVKKETLANIECSFIEKGEYTGPPLSAILRDELQKAGFRVESRNGAFNQKDGAVRVTLPA